MSTDADQQRDYDDEQRCYLDAVIAHLATGRDRAREAHRQWSALAEALTVLSAPYTPTMLPDDEFGTGAALPGHLHGAEVGVLARLARLVSTADAVAAAYRRAAEDRAATLDGWAAELAALPEPPERAA